MLIGEQLDRSKNRFIVQECSSCIVQQDDISRFVSLKAIHVKFEAIVYGCCKHKADDKGLSII